MGPEAARQRVESADLLLLLGVALNDVDLSLHRAARSQDHGASLFGRSGDPPSPLSARAATRLRAGADQEMRPRRTLPTGARSRRAGISQGG